LKVIAQESDLRSESEIGATSPKYNFSLKNSKSQHENAFIESVTKLRIMGCTRHVALGARNVPEA
jgi:hypothetical protein